MIACYRPPGSKPHPTMMPRERGAEGIKGSLEDDEQVTQKYSLTLGWGDDQADSTVWEGKFGQNDTMIRLVPAVTSPTVEWSKAMTGNPLTYSGHLVLKIVVLEEKDVPELGLKALDIAYLWIGKRGRGNSEGQGAAIYTIKPNGKVKLEKKLLISGMCYEDHGGRAMAHARPEKQCNKPLAFMSNSEGTSIAAAPFKTRRGPALDAAGLGLWVTCMGGCCEVRPD